MTIRVVVVDDEKLIRLGIVSIIHGVDGIEVIAEAASGEEALQIGKQLQPDVMLMDIRMPGIGGLEATKKLAYQVPHTKVVVVTALEENPFPARLLKAGAFGYISKGADLCEMVTAIKHAVAGKRYISPVVAQQMVLGSMDAGASSPFQQLSKRELQICLMVVEGIKVQDISDKLCLSPKTVNTNRYRIFEKLGVNGDVELTRLAIRHGLLDDQSV